MLTSGFRLAHLLLEKTRKMDGLPGPPSDLGPVSHYHWTLCWSCLWLVGGDVDCVALPGP